MPRFTDLTQTFPLTRGKGSRDPEDVGAVGYFKGTVKMYPLPDDGSPEPTPLLANVPSTAPIDVIVRVYIIRVSHMTRPLCVCVQARGYYLNNIEFPYNAMYM